MWTTYVKVGHSLPLNKINQFLFARLTKTTTALYYQSCTRNVLILHELSCRNFVSFYFPSILGVITSNNENVVCTISDTGRPYSGKQKPTFFQRFEHLFCVVSLSIHLIGYNLILARVFATVQTIMITTLSTKKEKLQANHCKSSKMTFKFEMTVEILSFSENVIHDN